MKTYYFKPLLLCVMLVSAFLVSAQMDESLKQIKLELSVDLIDEGRLDEAIDVLNEVLKYYPNDYVANYEKAYAYNFKQDYAASNKALKPLFKKKPAEEGAYLLMGCNYSDMGKPDKANKVFEEALKYYPESYRACLEMGTVAYRNKDYNRAVECYERGVKINPMYASTYYRLATIYCASQDPIWGMIYGELFMLLELGGERNMNVSEMLFNSYKNNINLYNGDSAKVSFCKNIVINIDINSLGDPMNLLKQMRPFAKSGYEEVMLLSVIGEQAVTLESLNRIRGRFIKQYYDSELIDQYPIALFEYHKKLQDAGHFEAYNYWLLRAGDLERFGEWLDEHKEQWDGFVAWMSEHPFEMNQETSFLRYNYTSR